MIIAKIKHIANHKNEVVTLNGWVYNTRRSGKIGFLTLRDGFGLLQCIIVKNEIGDELFEDFKGLTQESSLSIIGKVVKNDRAIGGYEILVENFEIHHLSQDYPITQRNMAQNF